MLANHLSEIAGNDEKFADAGRGHGIDSTLQQRLAAYLKQAFGLRIG